MLNVLPPITKYQLKNNTCIIFKKFILIIFFTFINLYFSQNKVHRFFYELTFKPKITSNYLKKTTMVLDLEENKSTFKDYQYIISDSIAYENLVNNQQTGKFEQPKTSVLSDFTFTITKDVINKEIEFTDFIMNGLEPLLIGYKEYLKFDWTITQDTAKIGDYICQKATVKYGGREWSAWFSNDIPINDGPYKFYGLPGLIIKIEDKDKNYSWKLVGNKKISINTNNPSILTNIKTKFVSKQDFLKTFNSFKQNPMNSFKNGLSKEILDVYVPDLNMKLGDYIDGEATKVKSQYSNYNNVIEIDEK